MDYKKTNAPSNTVTRDMMDLCADTGNIYETVAIIGKRANQISVEMKNDLSKKLQDYGNKPCLLHIPEQRSMSVSEAFRNNVRFRSALYFQRLLPGYRCMRQGLFP